MMNDMADPRLWDGEANRALAHDFTAAYARDAWRIADVPTGGHVLDIAAGTGALALVAAEAGADVLATDFSTAMVEAIAARGHPRITARVMDGQALPLPTESVDAAFSMFGIMLFPDWQAGMRELARVLRPGGIGCIGTWQARSGAAANLLLERFCAALLPEVTIPAAVPGMETLRDPAKFAGELDAVGFRDIAISRVEHDFVVDAGMLADPDQLFRFSAIWPTLDTARQMMVVRGISEALAARGGTLAVPSPALIGTGVRA